MELHGRSSGVGPLIDDAFGFAFASLDGSELDEADGGVDADGVFYGCRQFPLEGLEGADLVGKNFGGDFNLHLELIEALVARKDNLVVGEGAAGAEQCRLDLRGEDVNAADDNHVVAAAGDAMDSAEGPAAGTGAGDQACDVARAVADHRHGLFAEGGEDEFALVAIFEDAASFGVDDLGIEVILQDVEAVLAGAFDGDAGADDLR